MYFKTPTPKYDMIMLRLSHSLLCSIGLAPWRVSCGIRRGELFLSISRSRFLIIYNMILVMILIFLTRLGRSSVPFSRKGYEIVAWLQFLLGIIANIVSMSIIALRCASQQQVIESTAQLENVHKKYIKLVSDECQLTAYRRFQRFKLIGLFLIIWLSVHTLLYIHFPAAYYRDQFFVGLIFNCTILDYVSKVMLLKDTMIGVNDKLRDSLDFTKSMGALSAMADKLTNIREIHSGMGKLAKYINDFYSLPILMIVVVSCGDAVQKASWSTIAVGGGDFRITFEMCLDMISITLFLTPLLILGRTIENFHQEMNRTTEMVIDLRLVIFSNEKLETKLNDFCLELLADDVKFSAHGLFPLNATLIRSVATIVLTYIIVILQFTVTS